MKLVTMTLPLPDEASLEFHDRSRMSPTRHPELVMRYGPERIGTRLGEAASLIDMRRREVVGDRTLRECLSQTALSLTCTFCGRVPVWTRNYGEVCLVACDGLFEALSDFTTLAKLTIADTHPGAEYKTVDVYVYYRHQTTHLASCDTPHSFLVANLGTVSVFVLRNPWHRVCTGDPRPSTHVSE